MKNYLNAILVILLFSIFFLKMVFAQELNFSVDSVLNVSGGPKAVLSGDFNNDNAGDLANGITQSSDIHIKNKNRLPINL